MKKTAFLLISAILLNACNEKTVTSKEEIKADSLAMQETSPKRTSGFSETKNAYFGNMHVHTSYSFDGYTNKCPTTPDDAFRWAKGETIPGGGGGNDLTIKVPLDFYAVSDHAEWLGIFKNMENPESPLSRLDIAKDITSPDPAVSFQAFADFLYDYSMGKEQDPLLSDPNIMKPVWKEIIETSDKHYQPGKFTTFTAFEWSSNPNTRNLHRVVVFKDSKNIPELPFSSNDSEKPEDLWKWMDKVRGGGATLLAIPHNANASDGLMFSLLDSEGNSIDKNYSNARMANEPLYEISQIKGTSEAHPDLSQNDEFANFEQWDYTLAATAERPKNRKGSFIREALKDGIKLQIEGSGNPFKYGIIGDSDTHNSAASIEEDNYTGKFAVENNPEHRLNGFLPNEKNNQQVREFSSGGLAGVWAEENTREAIFNAMMRKETFGTSGPRMKVRFFGSFDFSPDLINRENWLSTAYNKGVPMGSDLVGTGSSPVFAIHALKETDGANLDRVQIVKGWVDQEGETHEKVHDIAWSGDRKKGADGKIPAVGNTVDLKTASYSNTIGTTEFLITWIDTEFDASQSAFYYVRVLEIPTPRWSTYDAVKLGIPIRKDIPATIQERAWSSPIWYHPSN